MEMLKHTLHKIKKQESIRMYPDLHAYYVYHLIKQEKLLDK